MKQPLTITNKPPGKYYYTLTDMSGGTAYDSTYVIGNLAGSIVAEETCMISGNPAFTHLNISGGSGTYLATYLSQPCACSFCMVGCTTGGYF
ncbi:MAG: hypothetical protein IPH24_13670 [Crocinitomicaceae bacterium]|nr:hypothetical protein [Crocinitomicaceae bacterium]